MKTFIAIPAQDQIDTSFARSLVNLQLDGEVSINFSESSLVYDSRNKLSSAAVVSGADYVLWFDTDMVFSRDLFMRLKTDIENGADVVCGLFFARRPPYQPCIYKKIRKGAIPEECISERYDDYPTNRIFEVDACGFAAVMMKAEVLEKVIAHYHDAFSPIRGYGEDISFCIRAKELGFKLFCDPEVKVGHQGCFVINENVYKQYREVCK